MRRFITIVLTAAMLFTCVPIGITYASETAESVFYDDFENGYAFWNCGTDKSMRIVDGNLINDTKDVTTNATLLGETTKLDSFVLETVFSSKGNSGWFGVAVNGVQFYIENWRVYTTKSPTSADTSIYGWPGIGYTFNDDTKYLFRVEVSGNAFMIKFKPETDANFAKQWTGTFDNVAPAAIKLISSNRDVKIDSVKLIESASDKVLYFPDKFVAIDAGTSNKQVPAYQSGFTPASVTYSSSSDAFTVADDGTVTAQAAGTGSGDAGVITATATDSEGVTYTAKYDVVRTYPIKSLMSGNTGFSKMTVGDTRELKVTYSPANATNRELIWTTDNPDAIEIIGDTEGSRGIRAIAPAKNVRICAAAKDNPKVKFERYVTVEGRPSEIKVQEFTPDSNREIPSGMFGLSDIHSFADVDKVKEYQETNLQNWKDLKLQQFRGSIDDINLETGKVIGSGVEFDIAEILATAIELDVPVNFSLESGFNSAEKIIKLADVIKATGYDKEICFGIWEECYDGQRGVSSASQYTDFLKQIYPKVKEKHPDVKIGATIIDYPSYQGFGNGVGSSETNMTPTWNHDIAAASDYYDAVVVHHYSGGAVTTTKGIMEGFSIDSRALADGLKIQAEQFPNEEFWINEWGDLPQSLIFKNEIRSDKARNQYMKSLGNALGYLQRILDMTLDEKVTMSAYHAYNDAQGFGTVQNNGETKFPSYYMFAMVGDLFENNSHIYSMAHSADDDLHYRQDMSKIRKVTVESYFIDVSLVNGWAFGDETTIKEAVFENTSEYPVKVYIPGCRIKKTMSYGDGTNPLPDLAVNANKSHNDAPSVIPEPVYYTDEEFSDYILMEPYSVIRVDTEPASIDYQWVTEFEDDFSGDLSGWTVGSGFKQENEAMKLSGHGSYLTPDMTAASDIAFEFDMTGGVDFGNFVDFVGKNSSNTFRVSLPNTDFAKSNLAIGNTDLTTTKPVTGNLPGGTAGQLKKNSVKLVLEDGNLTLYIKSESDSDYVKIYTFSQKDATVAKLINPNEEYKVRFYQVNGTNSDVCPVIDNVKIQVYKAVVPDSGESSGIEGTPEIAPYYETVFEDDFSGVLSKWTHTIDLIDALRGESVSVTDGTLKLKANDDYVTPTVDVSSEALEIEYDVKGDSYGMLLHFYNAEDENDYFQVRCAEGVAQAYDSTGNFSHTFSSTTGVVNDEIWRTVKFVLNDGLLDVYVKNQSEPEFIEREHRKGRPYSSVWYDSDDTNVSFMKKGVKYGVKIFLFNNREFYLDNFKIRAVKTDRSETATKDGVEVYTVDDLEIKVKTDNGYELTSMPIKGATNRFSLKSTVLSGQTISGKLMLALFDGNRFYDVISEDMATETEVEMDIPLALENPSVKLMIWDDLNNIEPMIGDTIIYTTKGD